MHIGSAIRCIRKKVSLSQYELSQRCDITQTALSQIEVGVKMPSQRTLEKICNALEIPEFMIYILALEQEDISDSKREAYNVVYPIIQNLLLQMAMPSRHFEISQN
jgi:transcriptional regulator with XRE-family HTH domain